MDKHITIILQHSTTMMLIIILTRLQHCNDGYQ